MIRDGFFYFDPEDGIYRDHFPDHPVVPGSLIVQAFVKAIGVPADGPLELAEFRFKRFIAPGTYRYHLDDQGGHIACRLYDRDITVVTGQVKRCI